MCKWHSEAVKHCNINIITTDTEAGTKDKSPTDDIRYLDSRTMLLLQRLGLNKFTASTLEARVESRAASKPEARVSNSQFAQLGSKTLQH